MAYKSVQMALELCSDVNRLLTQSAQASGRSKRSEALIRLRDHLTRYESIATLGDTRKRSKPDGDCDE